MRRFRPIWQDEWKKASSIYPFFPGYNNAAEFNNGKLQKVSAARNRERVPNMLNLEHNIELLAPRLRVSRSAGELDFRQNFLDPFPKGHQILRKEQSGYCGKDCKNVSTRTFMFLIL